MSGQPFRNWVKRGDPWIWLNAGAVAVSVVMVVALLGMIAVRGLGHFWPTNIERLEVRQGEGTATLLGQHRETEAISSKRLAESGVALETQSATVERRLFKIGNRDVSGQDFVWVLEPMVTGSSRPEHATVIERAEWGDFIGFVRGLEVDGAQIPQARLWGELDKQLQRTRELADRIETTESEHIGAINHALDSLRLRQRRLVLEDAWSDLHKADIEGQREQLQARYSVYEAELSELYRSLGRDRLLLETDDGTSVALPLADVIRIYQPNRMGVAEKAGLYLSRLWSFISEGPREANTEGGVFPAIFGTVIMVILMSVIVTPFGVLAAIYLKEYARQGPLTRAIRIAVSNLAGVPSIVYGVFGLGFFVYAVGGTIDQLFYPEALPSPTFGTGGILWASLTLALLTLPVVIVSTEEGLTRIPRTVREGSYALGATRAETLWRVVLPMSSPAIMTGVILAVARAAGEVAPLMLVGVVKLAPSLLVDSYFPFFHPERKFMHLGFHIYDVGFQSPNVEAARPLVFSTALLLVIVIILLNFTAVRIRNRLREKFSVLDA